VPRSVFPKQDLAVIKANWTVQNTLLTDPSGAPDFDVRLHGGGGGVTSALADAWRRSISDHPVAYVRVRWRLLTAQLGVADALRGGFYGGTDQIGWAGDVDLAQSFAGLNSMRVSWLQVTAPRGNGGLLFAPIWYLVAGILGAAVLIRRASPSRAFGWSMVAL